MKRNHFKKAAAIIGLTIGLSAFQNCGQVAFNSNSDESQAVKDGTSVSPNPDPNPIPPPNPDPIPPVNKVSEDFRADTSTVLSQSDILFVVDESASMGSVLATFQAGFASLSSAVYPQDTMMAVTNMAPAYYTDVASYTMDLTNSFYKTAATQIFTQQPGFLQLITGSSISSFISANSSYTGKFPLKGCSAWFKPTDNNVDGQSCLNAHTQVGLIATGVEAGIVSLDQLVRRNGAAGKALFRPGSLVNIVFVSDTHDPGANYYGRPGAPAALPDYNAVTQTLMNYNPGIRGVKYNAIAPMPPAGDAALTGVNYVGTLPATLADSKISGEDLHSFSYLGYVAKSGGVAMHPVNDWKLSLPKIIEETKVLRAPAVTLRLPAKKILKVIVEGVEIDPSKYVLANANMEVQLQSNPTWPDKVLIHVEYEN